MLQGAEAAGSDLNSSIGVALKDDGSPLVLPSLAALNNLPDEALLYSGSAGEKSLREAWSRLKKQPFLPVVTAGLTHGLNLAGHLILNPGDTPACPPPLSTRTTIICFGGYFQTRIAPFPLTAGGPAEQGGDR